MKLSRELWLEVEPLLTVALDLPRGDRDGWLAGVDATHPRAAPVLRRMLATHDRAEGAGELETATRFAAAVARGLAHAAGEAVGPFVLVSLLGRGGMGEVWLARHADGHLEREVALKLPAPHQLGEIPRERFQRERDILARLEHPNIARLYDAGVTAAGQPWLAMERVGGVALTEAAAALPVAQRLALFRQVLAAVAHAHRHLVVHRDLKPANILVDGAGQAKLLDFGIAKLVADDAAGHELTRLGGRVMTLRYAAPEQVAGGDITTATDIYSLGVILHELLTGESPYRAVREGRSLTDLALLQEQPTAPSRAGLPAPVSRLMAGDLDAIVLKAMRPEPQERYASIEQLDADIAAHLERRPVQARRGTWRYLAGRFALRHRLPLALGVAIVATLAVGLVAADHERRIAVAEKARAERHLASVRSLANTFIFDIHGKIERLPGSLAAREALVRTSVRYLDALAAEPGADPGLRHEIAVGYRTIGNIQGQPGAANTGNVVEAVKSFEKAQRLFIDLERLRPGDLEVLREHHMASFALARARFLLVDPRWEGEIAAAIRLAQRAAALPGATPRDHALVPASRAEEAHLKSLMAGQDAALEAVASDAVAALEALHARHPGDLGVREILVLTYERAGGLFSSSKRTEEGVRRAIAFYRRGLERARELIALRPGDARIRELELRMVEQLALTISFTGDHRESDRVVAGALAGIADLIARDPANMGLVVQHASVLSRAAHYAYQLEDYPRAIRLSREGLAAAARLPPETLRTRDVRSTVAVIEFHLGAALCAAAGAPATPREQRIAAMREARPLLAASIAFLDAVRAEKLGTIAPEEEAWARAIVARCVAASGKLAGA